MNFIEAIDSLDSMIRNAKSVPLSSSVMISKDEALAMLATLREAMPQETEQAKEILQDRDDLMAKAREEAQKLVDQGRAERTKMVSKTEVIQAANAEAHAIVSRAETQSEELKTKADDYVDAKLAKFEILLNKTLKTVNRGREQLRLRLEAAADEVQPFNLEDSGEISGPISGPIATPPSG